MHPFPHIYHVTAEGGSSGSVAVSGPQLPALATAPPPQFDGPEGHWSPETLLTAAVADCFILTFRAVAKASRFDWVSLTCSVQATLNRVDGQSRFTHFATNAVITLPVGADAARATQLLEKAEHGCLVANSLNGTRALAVEVRYA